MLNFWRKLKNSAILALFGLVLMAMMLPLVVAIMALAVPLVLLVMTGAFYLRGWKA